MTRRHFLFSSLATALGGVLNSSILLGQEPSKPGFDRFGG